MMTRQEFPDAGRKVLVTDGDQRSTLAVVRSLGRRGVFVAVAAERQPCLASRSRYCSQSLTYPSPYERSRDFRDWLREQLDDGPFRLLIPMTDVTCQCVDADREYLSRHTRLAMAAGDALATVTDKRELLNLAVELGIPVPRTYRIDDLSRAAPLLKAARYPLVIKSRRSVVRADNQWTKIGVEYCYSPDEVVRTLDKSESNQPPPLIQERIVGRGIGAFFLFDRGRKVASFFHRRLREMPPSGGVSVMRESIPVDPALEHHAVRLLETLKWHGVAMVEFKDDDRDGIPKLMEVNARFWGSLQLAVDAGIDFPYLFYRMETGESVDCVDEYRVGAKSRWLLGDLSHLLARVLKSNSRLRLPEQFPGRLTTIREFLKFMQPGMKYEVIRSNDLRPGLFEMGLFVKSLGKNFLHRLRPDRQNQRQSGGPADGEADTLDKQTF